MSQTQLTPWQVYRWPAMLAAITVAGLLFALFGDGVWDAISWILLAIPLVVIASNMTIRKNTNIRMNHSRL